MFVIAGILLALGVILFGVYIWRPARIWRVTLPPFAVLRVTLPLSLLACMLSSLFALMGVFSLPDSVLIQAETLRASQSYSSYQTQTVFRMTSTAWTPSPTYDYQGTEWARSVEQTEFAIWKQSQTPIPPSNP